MIRLIKRYESRKLYDTEESRYVSLDEISGWIRQGQEVKVVDNATDFCTALLEEAHVALVTGDAFGAPGYVRLSFATSMDVIEEGRAVIPARLMARMDTGTVYAGDPARGEKELAPLLGIGKPLESSVGLNDYMMMQTQEDAAFAHGVRSYLLAFGLLGSL